MSLPELQQNPLVQRVIDIFDADGNGEVDFKGTSFIKFFLIYESFGKLFKHSNNSSNFKNVPLSECKQMNY